MRYSNHTSGDAIIEISVPKAIHAEKIYLNKVLQNSIKTKTMASISKNKSKLHNIFT